MKSRRKYERREWKDYEKNDFQVQRDTKKYKGGGEELSDVFLIRTAKYKKRSKQLTYNTFFPSIF